MDLPIAAGIVAGKSAYVIGSADSATLAHRQPHDVVVAVNASLSKFPRLVPDLIVVSESVLAGNTLASRIGMDFLHGVRCRHLIVICSPGTFDAATFALGQNGLVFDTAEHVRRDDLLALAIMVDGNPSTGIQAALLMRSLGASHVTLTGIGGNGVHAYVPRPKVGDGGPDHERPPYNVTDEAVISALHGNSFRTTDDLTAAS